MNLWDSKAKLRILFTIECYPPIISGSGIATKSIATGLAKRGHQVAVICPGKGLAMEKRGEQGVNVYRLSSVPVLVYREYSFSPFAKKSISSIFDQFRPHIVNLEDHFFISTAAYAEAKKRGIPVIGTNHFHPRNILPHSKLKKDTPIYKLLEKKFWDSFVKVFNRLEVVTVPSKTAAEIIKGAGITRPSIYVISNKIKWDYDDLDNKRSGSHIKESDYKIGDLKLRYGIGINDVVLISVSRLEEEKRIDVLIKALFLLKKKADFKFIVVGKGKQGPLLEKITRGNQLSPRVIFTGSQSDKQLCYLYKISDIFLTASEVELQGLSIMEAMANGLPVVASNSMAIPELVQDGVNGFLFEPGNYNQASEKILLLIKDRDLRKKMGKNSLKIIRRQEFNDTLDRFEEIYYSLLTPFRHLKAQ